MRRVMNRASRLIVSTLSKLIPKRRRKTYMVPENPDQVVEFPRTELHLSVVRHYFSCMRNWCDFREELPPTEELQEIFAVPRLNEYAVQRYEIKKYQAVEVFISFLLQLLCYKTDTMDPLKDQIDNLEKELRFLRTVLGDTSLQLCDDDEQVNNLLEEFEAVANEAGRLVHSLIFSTDLISGKMDEGLIVILNHMDHLKANIMKFLDILPLHSRATAPKTSVVDSPLIVDSLLHDLEVLIKREDNPTDDVKDQIQILHLRLVNLQSAMEEIGAPQRSEIGEVKEFLMRIGDMACEAEYPIVSFLVGDAPTAYLIIRLSQVITKTELIGTELQEIKRKYEIGALKFAKNFRADLPLQAKRNSEVDFVTVGLEDKEIHILEHLLGGTQHLQIISIIGMAGLGKTTFAKKLYDHSSISYKFDRCSFCVISQSYEKKNVLLDILNIPTSKSNMGEESLVEHLYKSLKGRRYLIVIDDMWDSNVWDDLKRCFPDDENGSRILITSRNKNVAPPNAVIYELPSLTNEECWDLLEKKVFHDETCPHELLGIGKKIAANCCGLPLAVVAVAGLLSTMDKEESQWEKVGENVSSFIFDDGDDRVMQILELSYKHLPEHLKRCFLYFGVFSKYGDTPVQELMRLWIAEGFIIIRKEQQKSAESVAEEYLMELIDKSLAIVSKKRSDGGVRACVIHDLLRDLCLRKCEEENFIKFVKRPSLTSRTFLAESHRIKDFFYSLTPPFDYRQNLRSFHGSVYAATIYASNMKLLRVFNFERSMVIPKEDFFGIEFLVCLRYLRTKELPASIGSLVNLEFLVVEALKEGVNIPSAIMKMMKLRYLQVFWDATYDADCNSSQRNNLEFLSTVNIYNLRDEETLKSSPHLRKLKCKCEVLWDEEKGSYRYPDLRFLTQLESLNMRALRRCEKADINFPLNIKKLTLNNLRLPWEQIMTAVGRLPKLGVLKLLFLGDVGKTWETGDGEFQQLKFLKLENVYISQWNVDPSEHFPRLQQLILSSCHFLVEIPSEVGEIASLQLIEVQRWCRKSLVESARRIQQEQYEMGNEELRVIINEVNHDSSADLEEKTSDLQSDEGN